MTHAMCRRFLLFLTVFSFLFLFLARPLQAGAIFSGVDHQILKLSLKEGERKLVTAPFPFQAFAVSDPEAVSLRFLSDGTWSAWKTLDLEEEDTSGSELIFVKKSEVFELKALKASVIEATLIGLDPIIAAHGSLASGEIDQGFPDSLKALRGGRAVTIRSREEWGADEGLLLQKPKTESSTDRDNGGAEEKAPVNICAPLERAYPGEFKMKDRVEQADTLGRALAWPWRYSDGVKKIIIHHTAQSLKDLDSDGVMTDNDYRMAVRAIYAYHTLTREWGDVGYHYLVDPNGTLYEGKSGGKDVIGAHILCQNSNTIGIAVMGNFQENVVSQKAFEGLVELTSFLAELYDINPLGSSSFRGTVVPNIATHGEIGEITQHAIGRGGTQCPGGFLKARIDELRRLVAQGGIKPDYSFSFDPPNVPLLAPLSNSNLFLTLTNTGQKTWTSVQLFGKGEKKASITLSSISVSPGAGIKVSIPLIAGLSGGQKHLLYRLSANKVSMPSSLAVTYLVEQPRFTYDVVRLQPGEDPLLVGEHRQFFVTLKNTGNFPWTVSGPASLSLQQVMRRGKRLSLLLGGLRASLREETAVAHEATFAVLVPVAEEEGLINYQFVPVVGREKGLKGDDLRLRLAIEQPKFSPRFQIVSAGLKKGFDEEVATRILNDGNFDWEPKTVWIQNASHVKAFITEAVRQHNFIEFKDSVFIGYEQGVVRSSMTIVLSKSPSRIEGKFPGKSKLVLHDEVRTEGIVRLSAQIVAQSQKTVLGKGGSRSEWIELKNTGTVPWYRQGPNRFEVRSLDGVGVQLQEEKVMPGATGKILIAFQKTPLRTKTYRFEASAGGKKVVVRGGRLELKIEGKSGKKTSPPAPLPLRRGGRSRSGENTQLPVMRVLLTKYSGEMPDASGGIVRREDDRYRGTLEFRMLDGKTVAINELSLEDYMKGIAEVPESDDQPMEKRKVIAVLSRTYALHYLVSGYEKFPGKPYNASDDPAVFQKYLGKTFEQRSPKWQQALKDTDDEVILADSSVDPSATREQRVLRAAYFSCTDGVRTKSLAEAGWDKQEYFKRFAAVFQSVDDPLGDDPTREGKTACGHQVGLSGYGATQMAKQGKGYQDIIDFYYRHIGVEKW